MLYEVITDSHEQEREHKGRVYRLKDRGKRIVEPGFERHGFRASAYLDNVQQFGGDSRPHVKSKRIDSEHLQGFRPRLVPLEIIDPVAETQSYNFV